MYVSFQSVIIMDDDGICTFQVSFMIAAFRIMISAQYWQNMSSP